MQFSFNRLTDFRKLLKLLNLKDLRSRSLNDLDLWYFIKVHFADCKNQL